MSIKLFLTTLLFILVFVPSYSFAGFLTGTGDWRDMGPTDLTWSVTWDGSSQSVHYAYTFTVQHHDISHFSLELSNGFSGSDITNVMINGSSSSNYSIGSFTGGNAPYNTMPGDMYGIKFDMPNNTLTATIEFDSTRLPEWGDFYARCGSRVEHELPKGSEGWKEWNSAWNTGFATGETAGAGNDPVVLASSGSSMNHILVPDSVAAGSGQSAFSYNGSLTLVPEPVSTTLFVIGGGLLAGRRFLRRKK